MDASYKIQRGIHVHLIQFFMCPEFWVHIREAACVKIDKAKVDFCADFEYDIGTKVWWYQW